MVSHCQSEAAVSSQEGQADISHPLQLLVAEALLQTDMVEKTDVPFHHPTPICTVDPLPQAWKAENTGSQ